MSLKPGEFPTRELCDPNDPEEAFLWAFVGLPGVNGAPLVMPVAYMRQVSKRLWDLGFRHVEQPTLEWVAPTANEPNWMTSPGRWVPAGSTPPASEEQQARAGLVKMTAQQRHELLQALEVDTPPATPAGRVVEKMTLHQRHVVRKVLRDFT